MNFSNVNPIFEANILIIIISESIIICLWIFLSVRPLFSLFLLVEFLILVYISFNVKLLSIDAVETAIMKNISKKTCILGNNSSGHFGNVSKGLFSNFSADKIIFSIHL